MSEEHITLLHGAIQNSFTPQQFIYFGVIIIFSAVNFFSDQSFSKFLLIDSKNLLLVVPFFTNVFTEVEIPMLVVNSVFSIILFSLLHKYWNLQKILSFTYPVAVLSNAVVGIFAFLTSPSNSTYKFCGSLSLNVSLCCALCHAARGERQHIVISSITLFPPEIFYFILFWIMLCIRWPPFVALSGPLAAFLSYLVLTYFHGNLNLPRNENFSWKSFVYTPKDERETPEALKTPSILDSIDFSSSQTLSEADQNRRLRALRAIEERLATAASVP